MSYRESYTSWFERCKSDEEHMMSSFADICKNKKVPLNPKVGTLKIWVGVARSEERQLYLQAMDQATKIVKNHSQFQTQLL